MIKSKMMRWVGHVARVAETRMHAGFLWVHLKEMDYFEDVGVDLGGRRIIKKKKYVGEVD
jgi:hypothetical protein